jgi:hypothetical protein
MTDLLTTRYFALPRPAGFSCRDGRTDSTAEAVAEALGSSPDVVSSTLSELKKRGDVNNAVDGHTTREWSAVI